MRQMLMVVLTAVAIVAVGVGTVIGLQMLDADDDATLDAPISVSVFIDYGNGNTTTHHVRTVNGTALGALLEAAMPQNGGFVVETTYWASLDATLVDRIGDRTNGDDGRYWQYRVNGEYVNAGADRCILSDGDLVEWSFEESNW